MEVNIIICELILLMVEYWNMVELKGNKPSGKGKEDFYCGGQGARFHGPLFTQLPLPPPMFWVLLNVKF